MKALLYIFLFTVIIPLTAYSQWTRVTSLTQTGLSDMYIDSAGNFFVSSSNGGFYRSLDNTASWQAINSSLSGDGLRTQNITKIDNVLWGSTVNGPYKSTDNGTTWERKINGMIISGGSNNYFINAIAKINGVMYTSTYGAMYRSTDDGENWVMTNVVVQGCFITCYLLNDTIMYAGRDNINTPIMYKSTNNGVTWTNQSVWNNFPVGVFCFYKEPGKIFTGTGHGMFLSTDGGSNWVMRNNGLSSDPYVSCIIRSGNTMIASLQFGGGAVYKTTDEGLNWTNVTANLPFMNTIGKIINLHDTVYLAGSAGLWKRAVNDIVTSAGTPGEVLPDAYNLGQNYPNPFNPQTVINYQLSMSNYVKLAVYDINGRLIETLINQKQPAGAYQYTFDGSRLSSGVYFYSLFADGKRIETKRMLLLK